MIQQITLAPYWLLRDWHEAQAAKQMAELAPIALGVLNRMPRPIVQICGPMSTGGHGDLEANLVVFNRAIEILAERGLNVFNQLPFQEAMLRIIKANPVEGYCQAILDDFYLPVFQSGLVSTAYFLPQWFTSVGARWERQTVCDCRIPIVEFPEEWLTTTV